ncbi:MAG: hypothetical protein F2667_07840 [Actinobacteria bacterium]|nr:hypothetical protein [Actinomycetota bacterium]
MATLAEQFVDDLDADLAKRRRELIDLRLMISSGTGSRLAMLGRTCQVMAYAHWEGFVKHALQTYLEYIVMLQPKLGDLRLELQALSVRHAMRLAVAPERDIAQLALLIPSLDARANDVFVVDPKEIIRSGNLTADTLRVLLGCSGLQFGAIYQARENYIDSVICGRRHRVAHGSWQPVTPTEARDLLADVMSLCQEINDQVQTAVVYEHYRI